MTSWLNTCLPAWPDQAQQKTRWGERKFSGARESTKGWRAAREGLPNIGREVGKKANTIAVVDVCKNGALPLSCNITTVWSIPPLPLDGFTVQGTKLDLARDRIGLFLENQSEDSPFALLVGRQRQWKRSYRKYGISFHHPNSWSYITTDGFTRHYFPYGWNSAARFLGELGEWN